MILSAKEMRALEESAFARGVTAETLMNQAGERSARAVIKFFPRPGVCVAVFGKGNNGGDALVAARHLAGAGWQTHLVPAFPESEWNPLVHKKFAECGLASHFRPGEIVKAAGTAAPHAKTLVVLDGLLGVGAHGPLRGAVAEAARDINRLRQTRFAQVFALDLPTGLDADTGEVAEDGVRADFTLAIGAPKRGHVAEKAEAHVGRLVVVPLEELAVAPSGDALVTTPAVLAPLLPRRSFDMHKGQCGRVAIVAGSRGLTGAALLCAEAATRAGAGLVSLYVLEDVYLPMASASAPEVMVRPISAYKDVLDAKFTVMAVGPGLGQKHAEEVRDLISQVKVPMIIDADGLNLMAGHLDRLPAGLPRLFTPHTVEMQRLDPDSAERSRVETVRRFTAAHPLTLLLKGARTIVGEAGRPLSYNTTGSAGMATGGMGDVLTGVCTALAGQGLSMYDAARVGAWLCGRAAEFAIHAGTESEESLTARSVLAHLGQAFGALRRGWV